MLPGRHSWLAVACLHNILMVFIRHSFCGFRNNPEPSTHAICECNAPHVASLAMKDT